MSLFKFFHSNKDDEIDIEKEKNCIRIIKQSVSEKCGISDFIDYDDFTVAFAGSILPLLSPDQKIICN